MKSLLEIPTTCLDDFSKPARTRANPATNGRAQAIEARVKRGGF